jgi:hypothetical protein
MSVLASALHSSDPVVALRQLWSSLGTTVFLEAVTKSLREAVQTRELHKLHMVYETKLHTALLTWHFQAKSRTQTSQMLRLKILAAKLLKERRKGTNGRIPKVEIKSSKTLDENFKPVLHIRSQSQVCMTEASPARPAFSTPTHSRQSKTYKDGGRQVDSRPKSTDPFMTRPLRENESMFNKLKAGLQQKAKKAAAKDVGTRLFNKAEELARKKEALKLCYTPEYSFTPKLNTGYWLPSKSKDDTVPKEEVAVVSSSIGLCLKS